MAMLKVGDLAPDFKTTDQDGNMVSLRDFKGKRIVLYFYPKDDTSGCTREACAFRDHYGEFRALGADVLGVSTDDEKSHGKFAAKYQLPFTLLADSNKEIVNSYGAWGEKSLYGRKYKGTHRITYLIGESGKIMAVFPKVKPEAHAQEIIALLKSIHE